MLESGTIPGVRVLDIDLDFFLHGVAHYRASDDDRLDSTEVEPWSIEEAMSFLQERCKLTAKLPGAVVEHHGQMFERWRSAIRSGELTTPFHVTHVDAHADLGLGDAGYIPLVTNLLYRDPADRDGGTERPEGLGDGNFLAFAIANRWISTLDYVHNDGGGGDLLTLHMRDCDNDADSVELKAMSREEMDRWLYRRAEPRWDRVEPRVPFRQLRWDQFAADEPYDAVCLCRSPGFTPASSDELFDLIRKQFIDEGCWPA
jgi:hypothetical protein